MAYFTHGGYKVSVPKGIANIAGSLIAASEKPLDMLLNKDLSKVSYYSRRLLDPQIYLADLDPSVCSERCTRLATYGYFEVGELDKERTTSHQAILAWIRKSKNVIADHWTGALPSGSEVDTSIRAALAVQAAIGCEALVLPGPLTRDLNSDLATELDWLDRGIAIGRSEFDGARLLASLAISDLALRAIDPFQNRLVSTLLDEISSREPDGVLITLELAGDDGYYCTSAEVVGALLRFVDGFKRADLSMVVLNYATVAGLVAYAAGADTWVSGWYKGERRLQIADCADKDEGASAFPAYYSHPLAGEIHLGNDMMRIGEEARLLAAISDETSFSGPLLAALRKKLSVTDVLAWRPRRNNVTAARGHFATAMGRETARIDAIGSTSGRLDHVEKWLEGAVALAAKINAIGDLHPRTEILHQRAWLKALRGFRDQRKI